MSDAFRDRMLEATKVVRGQERELKRRIAGLYARCAQDMEKEILHYGEDTLTGRRAAALQKTMRGYVKGLWKEVHRTAEEAVQQGAALGIEAQASLLDDAVRGIRLSIRPSFKSMFARTQDEAVASVLNGSIYSGPQASLSRRIWNNEALQGGQIERLIAEATAKGRSATELARDLEAYVNPKAAMPDNWNDVYEQCPFPFRVDYNAKRLAVASLNHSYYQGMLMAARENPYAEYLHWELSSMHLIYDVCDTYMEHDEGLGLGNFSLDNAPLPHPFCRCLYYVDSSKSLSEIGDEIGRWISGEENSRLDGAFGEWKAALVQSSQQTWKKYIIEQPDVKNHQAYPAPEIVQRVQSTVDRIAEEFPALAEHLESVQFAPESGIGAARGDGKVIRLDNSIFSSMEQLKKVFDASVAQGYTVNASDPMFIVAHECGHALENIVVQKALAELGLHGVAAAAKADDVRRGLGISYFLHAGFSEESLSDIRLAIKHELGGRANDNSSELMAQAVAMKYFGIGSHPIADSLVNYLKELLEE